jgi:hypothetical protein
MPVGLLSRYRNQPTLDVESPTRGRTRSLPIRRIPLPSADLGNRIHQFGSYDTADLLALQYFGREDLYWALLDANDGQLPDPWEPGETLAVPPVNHITRVQVPGR